MGEVAPVGKGAAGSPGGVVEVAGEGHTKLFL